MWPELLTTFVDFTLARDQPYPVNRSYLLQGSPEAIPLTTSW